MKNAWTVYEAFRMMYKNTLIIFGWKRAPPSGTPKAWALLQIQCFYSGHLLNVWKNENGKLEEFASKICDKPVNNFAPHKTSDTELIAEQLQYM